MRNGTNTLVAVESNDAGLADLVTAWLNESRLPLPAESRIRLEVTDQIPNFEDSRPCYSQAGVDVRAGEPLDWVHLRWQVAPAMARIEAESPAVTVHLSREALADWELLRSTFLMLAVIFVCRRGGMFHLHAGTAVDPVGRGWLLTGNTGAGKSTTIALLASRGWEVGTDDVAFLRASHLRAAVVGIRVPIALRPGGRELLARHQGEGVALTRRNKTGFYAEELGGRWRESVEPEFVLFTELGNGKTRLTVMQPTDVMRVLVQSSPWVLFESIAAQEHLDLLARLSRQARCFRAQLAPDLFDAPGALADFLP
jgi:hypothetical protein